MSQRKLLRFSTEAMEAIARQVMAAFNSIPRRGAESGGLLLGTETDDELQILDFEPVVCTHRYGPAFILDEGDCRGLEKSLSFCNSGHPDALPVAGVYRSNTRFASGADARDVDLLARYFQGRPTLFFVLQPARDQSIRADIFRWTGEECQRVASGLDFPLPDEHGVSPQDAEQTEPQATATVTVTGDREGPAPEAREAQPPVVPAVEIPREQSNPDVTAATAAVGTVAPAGDPEPRVERSEAGQNRPSGRWLPFAVASVLAVPAAYLGYRAAQPGPAEVARTAPVQRTVPPAEAATRAGRTDPDPVTGVPALLEDWAAAHRAGQPREVAAFYAPTVSRYLGRRNLSRDDVSKQVAAFIGVHGVPVVFRISDLRIEPSGQHGAVATFRKHWQTAGARMHAGEEEHQLSLEMRDGRWNIAAQDELRVFWTHAAN